MFFVKITPIGGGRFLQYHDSTQVVPNWFWDIIVFWDKSKFGVTKK